MATFAIPQPVHRELSANHVIHSLAECYYLECPRRADTTSRHLLRWAIQHELADAAEINLLESYPAIAVHRDNFV